MLGIFDSGIGGLTVIREILRRAPETSFVYLGDTARTPYGNKSADTIKQYAIEDAAFLLKQGATDIIVACNTASSLALEALKETYPNVRFFDVISPAIRAVVQSHAQKIGVIGTRATINSGTYENRLKEQYSVIPAKAGIHPMDSSLRWNDKKKSLDVLSVACPLFVPLVEEGWTKKPETKRIVRTYLQPLRQKQIDALILGCTHYPLLQSVIRSALQKRVKIIDSPSALMDQIEKEAPELLNPPLTRGAGGVSVQKYYFTDVSAHTDAIASRWLGRAVKGEKALLN